MKKESFYSQRIFPLVFMFLITLVCITVVTGLYLSTKDQVEANEQLFLRKTILSAGGVKYSDDFREITTLFESQVRMADGFYEVVRADGSLSYVTPVEGPGLWGTISLMVGFNESLDALTGVGIFSQNETPGLGARIEEQWYLDQFEGKRGPFILVDEGTSDTENEIDAITGATRTSKAMQAILNRSFEAGPALVRGN